MENVKNVEQKMVPRGRLRRFMADHADEFEEVKALHDGSRAFDIICDMLADPMFDQCALAEKHGVGAQYLSQLMRDVEVFGSPLAYAQAKAAGKPVTRSRVRTDGVTGVKHVSGDRQLTPRQLADVRAVIADDKEHIKARVRAEALLLLHQQPYISYAKAAEFISEKLNTKVGTHEVLGAHYTLGFTGSVDAVVHGRLYASRKLYDAAVASGCSNPGRGRRPKAVTVPEVSRAVRVVSQIARVAIRNNLVFELDTKGNRVVINLAPGGVKLTSRVAADVPTVAEK